jgi:hypothetical protein
VLRHDDECRWARPFDVELDPSEVINRQVHCDVLAPGQQESSIRDVQDVFVGREPFVELLAGLKGMQRFPLTCALTLLHRVKFLHRVKCRTDRDSRRSHLFARRLHVHFDLPDEGHSALGCCRLVGGV